MLVATQPHEVDVLAQGFGKLPGGVDLLAVGVDQHFQQQLGVVTGVRLRDCS